MVREELLRRQLLAAEDKLLAALKHDGLEEFMVQWASLQETVQTSAGRGKLSKNLIQLNERVCQDIADIVESCLAVEDGINQAFNADDILSDFSLSNDGDEAKADPDILRSQVPSDDGVLSAISQRPSQHSEPHYTNKHPRGRSLPNQGDDSEDDSDFCVGKAAWLDTELENDDEGLDDPDPDWEKMQDWFLANIAFPFLAPDQPDPIIRTAPISQDHLETWVSEICQMCGWHSVYSHCALNDRSRMHALCEAAFGLARSEYSSGPLRITKKEKAALFAMREQAIVACNYLISSRAELTVELEKMADMLTQLPIGVGLPDGIVDEWSDVDWDTWEADVVDQYNQLSLPSWSPPLEDDENGLYCTLDVHSGEPTSFKGKEVDFIASTKHDRSLLHTPPQREQACLEHGLSPQSLKPSIVPLSGGVKRKLDEFLTPSDMIDPQHCVTASLQSGSPHPAEHSVQENTSAGSHRSKRRRSHSPEYLHHLASSPCTPGLLFPSSPDPSSPMSQSSSSGSESGSPPEDPNSPTAFPRTPPAFQHYSLPNQCTAKLESPSPGSDTLESSHTISTTSTFIASPTFCLPIPSSNLTAYSHTAHSLYQHHGNGTAEALQYSKIDTNPTLFNSNSRSSGETPASPEVYHQVQVIISGIDQLGETVSRPPKAQIVIERKRTRADFEVDLDSPENGSTVVSSTRSHSDRIKRRKSRPPNGEAHKTRATLPGHSSFEVRVDVLHHDALSNTTFSFGRADLDKDDVRPIKRSHLAPRDYSLSPDT